MDPGGMCTAAVLIPANMANNTTRKLTPNTMLAPTYIEMPPHVVAAGAPTYATPMHGPMVPGAYMGSISAGSYPKARRTWLNRLQPAPKQQRHQQQQLHPAALIHRDYLQEYREKYGTLSPELVLEPWHSMSPIAHHIHPAVVASPSNPHIPSMASHAGICACPGTKKLGKQCKTCGRRVAGVNKSGGTVRGGTIRGGTKVRPSLNNLPPSTSTPTTISPMRLRPTPTTPDDEEKAKAIYADPYDVMRRSRLSLQEKQGSIRTRSKSVSPSRARLSYPPTIPARTTFDTHRSRLDEWVASNDSPPLSRSSSTSSTTSSNMADKSNNKSILECDISAYELISKYLNPDNEKNNDTDNESDELSDNAILDNDNYEKWNIPSTIPRISKTKQTIKQNIVETTEIATSTPKPPPRKRRIKKPSIKSILKKTSLSSIDQLQQQSPTTIHFPTYQEFKQRKKQVQFDCLQAVGVSKNFTKLEDVVLKSERDLNCGGETTESINEPSDLKKHLNTQQLDVNQQSIIEVNQLLLQHQHQDNIKDIQYGPPSQELARTTIISPLLSQQSRPTLLPSETATIEKPKNNLKRREGGSIVHIRGDHHKLFLDTMRLRLSNQHRRGDSRVTFDISNNNNNRMLSPTRPKEPPPPPPPQMKSPETSPEIVTNTMLSSEIVRTPRKSSNTSIQSPDTPDFVKNQTKYPDITEISNPPMKLSEIPEIVKTPRKSSKTSVKALEITPEMIRTSKAYSDNSIKSPEIVHIPRKTSETSLTYSETPMKCPETSEIVIVTTPEKIITSPEIIYNDMSTIVTVNDEIILSDTSSNESEYNTLRINIGNDHLATILTVNGTGNGTEDDYEPIEPKKSTPETIQNNYETIQIIPHICSKGQVTISDTSIIEKVENKRSRSKLLESPYVSTSIRVSGIESWKEQEWPHQEQNGTNNIVVPTITTERDTDEESSSTRSKFYVTVEDEEEDYDDEEIEDHYEMIRDPIYEEISEPQVQAKSIFEGASKYDILNYLVGARERGIPLETTPTRETSSLLGLPEAPSELGSDLGGSSVPCSELVSHVSDSSEDTPLRSSPAKSRRSSAEIERNDSGVGSETSSSSRSRWLLARPRNCSLAEQPDLLCEDCDQTVEPQVTDSGVVYAPLVCRKCGKRRSERREIITELLETEIKYGRDLKIMAEEFYRPMLVAGLLSQEQLDAIFLNVPELIEVSRQLAERLQDAVDIALDQGDEDLLTVNVGRILVDCSHMLHAFETYCTRQGAASILLTSLEKEKELLKIFLRVSQMENAVLRRMNLNSFLMVPVQRVTKYPLLLARLYKSTPAHHEARELLKQAQQKIEAHLEHMNAEAKDLSSTKLWRRISIINVPYRRTSAEPDLNIRIRKLALEVLGWGHEDSSFVMEGRLLFTQPTDSNWRKGRTIKLSHLNALLVVHSKDGRRPNDSALTEGALTFPKDNKTQDAALLLLKDKGGRCSLLREPLSLDKCIICSELQDIEDCFEVQEIPTRDTFIFKAENADRTREWFRRLQFHAQGLGGWRRRRNALANIMMNGMVPRS